MPPAGVAKLSIAALKRTISRAGLSTDGIERRELEEAATRALQILEERWRESSDDEESPSLSACHDLNPVITLSSPLLKHLNLAATPVAFRLDAIHLSLMCDPTPLQFH